MWNSSDEHLELPKNEQGKEEDSNLGKEESKKDNNN